MQIIKPALAIGLGMFRLTQGEPIHKRASDHPIGMLYGYGSNISSLPLFVADGAAYLGNVSLSPIADASNVTFRFVADDGVIIADRQYTNSSDTTTNSTESYFSIDTASGASNPVYVESLSSESNYTSDSFYVYGTQIMWQNPDAIIAGTLESSFYAIESDVNGIWEVYWDADGAAGKKGNIIVLKSVPL